MESKGLRLHLVLNNGLPELHNFGVSPLVDYRSDLETRLGAETGRSMLIRPDGYVAFDLPELDAAFMESHLKYWALERQFIRQLAAVWPSLSQLSD